MTKKIRTYSTEFKAEAVKKIADNNGNVSATAKQLGIMMQTLSNWQNKANQGELIGTEQYNPELMAAIQEIKQLQRQQLKAIKNKRLSQGLIVHSDRGSQYCIMPITKSSSSIMLKAQ